MVGDFPAVVADDALGGAVLVGDFQLEDHFRASVVHHVGLAAPFILATVVAHSEVAAGGKDDADGIVALMQLLGHIKGVEIHSLAIVGEGGLEDLFRCNFRAVEESAVLAEAAHIEPCLADVVAQVKLLAQVSLSNTSIMVDVPVLFFSWFLFSTVYVT